MASDEQEQELQLIPPPVAQCYASEAAAEAALHAWTRSHGVWVYRCDVRKNYDGEVVMSVFRCDRGGKPSNWRKLDETTRKRHRPSRRIGCPMRIKLVSMDFYDPRGEWKIEYTPDGSALHNHPPDERRRQRPATATIDLTDDGAESDGQSLDAAIGLVTTTGANNPSQARAAPPSPGPQSVALPGASTPQPEQQAMSSMTNLPMPQPVRPVAAPRPRHFSSQAPPAPTAPLSYQQATEHTRPSVQTETAASGWHERRPPQSQILAFRESVFYLFGTQPMPVHVVESVEMKELVLALQPAMLPYLPTAREVREVILMHRRAHAVSQQHPSTAH